MKKWLFGVCIALCLAAGGTAAYLHLKSDRQGPEITITGELIYQNGMQEEDLLQGVTAWDEKDGDVSDTLVVETVTVDTAEQTAVIHYAARDAENNIVKATRKVAYGLSGAQGQTEMESESDTEPVSGAVRGGTGGAGAASAVSGTTAIPSSGLSGTEGQAGTEAETETETETEEETEQESESEILEPGQPVLRMNSLSATIHVGDVFNPLTYVASIEDDYDNIYELWRDIQVEGTYDTSEPGNYELIFYVVDSSGNMSNRANFLLRVKEN